MKFYKRLFITIFAIMMAFSLVGCGEIKKAESAVEGMFEAFKNFDLAEAQKYVNVDDIIDADNSNGNTELIMKTIFDNLSYEIISSEKVDESNVVVKTKITVTDMKPVMSDFFAKAMEYAFSSAFSNPQPTEEETVKKMEEILIECASKPNLATVTNEIDIKVIRNIDKEWKIEVDETLANAILGGMINASKELENALNTEE